jgi:hypothetical protein
MTVTATQGRQEQTVIDANDYTKFIVDSLAKGIQPVYDSTKAGQYAPLLDILLEDYNPHDLDEFTLVLEALKNKHKAFNSVLDITDTSKLEQDDRLKTGKHGKPVFRTLSMGDVKKLPRASWQVPGIYQKVSVSMTYGDANTGKTFVDLDIALCIAYGMEWQGRKLKQGRVLYIYGEGNEGLANRIEAWQQHNNKPETDNIQFICFPVQVISELETLCATIDDQESIPSLVIIDTFSVCAVGVEESNNVEIAKFIAAASYIKRNYKTHVHIIHHAGKNGDYRGASAFKGNIDTMVFLSREDERAPVVMTCQKQKDYEYFKDIRLELKIIRLGIDEESQLPITSCVVVASDTRAQSEDAAELEREIMLTILEDNGRMNVAKWREAANKQNVSKNKFYLHEKYLVQTHRVEKFEQGIGKSTLYSIVKEPIPPILTHANDGL